MSLLRSKKNKKKKRPYIRPDYQAKDLQNPFFQKKGTGAKKMSWWLWLIILAIFIGLIYVFLASPWFNIKEVNVAGLGRLPESAIQANIWHQSEESKLGIFKQENIFLFNVETAETNLMSEFNFSKIKITKKYFPNKLVVQIEERPYAFIWQEAGKSYYGDSQGYIINDQEVNNDDLERLPVIENQTLKPLIRAGRLDISSDYLNFIFRFLENSEKYPDLTIKQFIVPQEDSNLKSVRVLFNDGLLAYFDIASSIENRLADLEVVKTQKIKDNLSEVTHVDLRYGDKIFIGYK